MSLKKYLESHGGNIEKILIIGIIGVVFLALLINELVVFSDISLIVLQTLLIVFYMLQLNNKIYGLLWAGFLIGVLAVFISQSIPSVLYFILSTASFVVFGIVILIRTFKMSIQNKNFELLSFIMGFLLVLQAGLPFISHNEQVLTFYSFALAFSLGTIVYNDNLWHRFNQDEKNIIKYILIIALVLVIQSSDRYI